MKKYLVALGIAVAAVLAYGPNVSALTTTQYATKPVSVTVVITPSPAPVGYNAAPSQPAPAPAYAVAVVHVPPGAAADLPGLELARYIVEPVDPLVMNALGTQVAQVQSVPGGNVPVNVNVKPDPTAAYIHITPVTPILNAVYGMNTFTCAYRVFGFFSKTWKINDWIYGTTPTGGNAGFPGYGYPAASAASWSAQGISSSYTSFANTGTPGQLTFTGTANVSKDVCMDLQVNVTPDIPAGSYPLTITYALYVTF